MRFCHMGVWLGTSKNLLLEAGALGCLGFLPKAGEQCSDCREVLQSGGTVGAWCWLTSQLRLRLGRVWLTVPSLGFICEPGLTILPPLRAV